MGYSVIILVKSVLLLLFLLFLFCLFSPPLSTLTSTPSFEALIFFSPLTFQAMYFYKLNLKLAILNLNSDPLWTIKYSLNHLFRNVSSLQDVPCLLGRTSGLEGMVSAS